MAGLVGSIALARQGFSVKLLEQKEYPYHKVCGEYVSNEVRPYLERLDAFPAALGPKKIRHFELSSPSGKKAGCAMKMGGFGISRYAFDAFLAQRAREEGVELCTKSKATDISFRDNAHCVVTQEGDIYVAKVVLGAYGKRSKLNYTLNRASAKRRSAYIGVKHHFEAADFPEDLVALHNFKGGYCGLSKVESGHVNLCFLTTNEVFKQYSSIEEVEMRLLGQNPHLAAFFSNAKQVFAPLVISQVNFGMHERVAQHVLMCGDAAGLIHPLCGNGMAMAIHSAKIAVACITLFLEGKIPRDQMEQMYRAKWQSAFAKRLRFGHLAQWLLERNTFLAPAVGLGRAFPLALRQAVTHAHGTYL